MKHIRMFESINKTEQTEIEAIQDLIINISDDYRTIINQLSENVYEVCIYLGHSDIYLGYSMNPDNKSINDINEIIDKASGLVDLWRSIKEFILRAQSIYPNMSFYYYLESDSHSDNDYKLVLNLYDLY